MCPHIWACVSRIICGFEGQPAASGGAEIYGNDCVGLRPDQGASGNSWRRWVVGIVAGPSSVCVHLCLSVCICV